MRGAAYRSSAANGEQERPPQPVVGDAFVAHHVRDEVRRVRRKFVATMDTPMSHQGAALPDVKNSAVFNPARRKKKMAGKNEMTTEIATIAQSSGVTRMTSAAELVKGPRQRLQTNARNNSRCKKVS